MVAHASTLSFRAVAAVQVFHAPWFAVDAGVGGGVDVLTVESRSVPLGATVLSAPPYGEPILCAVITGHVGLAPGVVLTLAVGSDLDLASPQPHYVVEYGKSKSGDVLIPSQVRPFLLAGFAFTALGERRFARAVIQ